MMEHAHYRISTLAHVNPLIDEVVDLAWYGFAAHSKDGAFLWGEEVHGTWLEGVIRVEHLGHVERVVCCDGVRAQCDLLCRWWWTKLPGGREELVD